MKSPLVLSIRGSFTDDGAKRLAALTNLKGLALSNCDVTDAGLAHLAGLNGLESLSFYYTKVSGRGLKHLQGLANLRSLSVAGDSIPPEVRGFYR